MYDFVLQISWCAMEPSLRGGYRIVKTRLQVQVIYCILVHAIICEYIRSMRIQSQMSNLNVGHKEQYIEVDRRVARAEVDRRRKTIDQTSRD